MRKITAKEHRKAGNIYCDHCKPDHRQGDFACNEHKHLIRPSADNEHLSEADFQTWHRL